jgi:hypothetical protein
MKVILSYYDKEVKKSLLYSMQCGIFQDHTVVVLATGRFYKVK